MGSLTSREMSVASARATTSRTVHYGHQAVRAESNHAVDVEPVRVRRTAQRSFSTRSDRRGSRAS